MYYAPSTGGFYDPAIHGEAMPDDATPITQDQHADLIAAQAQGARIVAGPEGQPVADWPAPPGIDATRAAARAAMAAWIVEFTSQFTAGLPVAEVASWPAKSAAARAHLDGATQPMILAEAAVTGEEADDLARAILAKADLYTAIIARVTGLRRATEAQIATADTPEAVADALAASQKSALSMAAQMGVPQTKDQSNA